MSNNAMSNETDLDWLARNVHVWPSRNHQPWCYVYMAPGGVMKAAGNFLDAVSKPTMITIDQWLARRAELQVVTEKFKPSIEEANKMAQEFSLFTSIEDNQEREMNQDNGWCERGELPPVGFECEMKRIDGRWCKAVTVGKDSGGRMVCELNDNGVFYASTSSAESFRPIRTERDELIEIISSSLLVTTEQVADAIIAAGFKLEAK